MISIAPMLSLTTRHCRYFFRLLTKYALLYTEMISTGAILNNNKERILQYNEIEHPLALQLGGADPKALAECAKIGEDFGYDEINVNAGCPSARVQAGNFGACLMLEPELTAECILTMQKKVKIPVTVKTRLGIDDYDSYDWLYKFIQLIPAQKFIIHARKAYLKKSPKENRKINPSSCGLTAGSRFPAFAGNDGEPSELNYQIVHQLKKDFPQINFVLNGGFTEYPQIKEHLKYVDGIMVGRKAYRDPYFLANIDQEFYTPSQKITGLPVDECEEDTLRSFGEGGSMLRRREIYGETKKPKSRAEIVEEFMAYADKQIALGENISRIIKPLGGLYHGISGAKNWRRKMNNYFLGK